MPYSLNWYIENEVIYVSYSGETTIDELKESLFAIQKLVLNSPRQLVHVMSDVGDVIKPVSPKDALEVVREVGTNDKSGWNIILREKSLIIKLGVAFGTSIFKTRNRTFDTIEEAEAFLRDMDSTLSWDKVDKSVLMS